MDIYTYEALPFLHPSFALSNTLIQRLSDNPNHRGNAGLKHDALGTITTVLSPTDPRTSTFIALSISAIKKTGSESCSYLDYTQSSK